MFNQYKFDPADISRAAVAAADSLADAMPGINAPTFAAQVVQDRLRADPSAYLQFGPYWWAVKVALRQLGADFGPGDDPVVRGEYGGRLSAYAALVAGEQFRDFYRGHFLSGSNQFWLDDDGEESYVLFDKDMEARLLGQAATEADYPEDEQPGAVLDGVVVAPVLDSALQAPFEVPIAIGAVKWTVEAYGANEAEARERVKDMERSGRIARALDVARGIGQPIALDNTEYDRAMVVDMVHRRFCEI